MLLIASKTDKLPDLRRKQINERIGGTEEWESEWAWKQNIQEHATKDPREENIATALSIRLGSLHMQHH